MIEAVSPHTTRQGGTQACGNLTKKSSVFDVTRSRDFIYHLQAMAFVLLVSMIHPFFGFLRRTALPRALNGVPRRSCPHCHCNVVGEPVMCRSAAEARWRERKQRTFVLTPFLSYFSVCRTWRDGGRRSARSRDGCAAADRCRLPNVSADHRAASHVSQNGTPPRIPFCRVPAHSVRCAVPQARAYEQRLSELAQSEQEKSARLRHLEQRLSALESERDAATAEARAVLHSQAALKTANRTCRAATATFVGRRCDDLSWSVFWWLFAEELSDRNEQLQMELSRVQHFKHLLLSAAQATAPASASLFTAAVTTPSTLLAPASSAPSTSSVPAPASQVPAGNNSASASFVPSALPSATGFANSYPSASQQQPQQPPPLITTASTGGTAPAVSRWKLGPTAFMPLPSLDPLPLPSASAPAPHRLSRATSTDSDSSAAAAAAVSAVAPTSSASFYASIASPARPSAAAWHTQPQTQNQSQNQSQSQMQQPYSSSSFAASTPFVSRWRAEDSASASTSASASGGGGAALRAPVFSAEASIAAAEAALKQQQPTAAPTSSSSSVNYSYQAPAPTTRASFASPSAYHQLSARRPPSTATTDLQPPPQQPQPPSLSALRSPPPAFKPPPRVTFSLLPHPLPGYESPLPFFFFFFIYIRSYVM
jgi:hypothetical protein